MQEQQNPSNSSRPCTLTFVELEGKLYGVSFIAAIHSVLCAHLEESKLVGRLMGTDDECLDIANIHISAGDSQS